MGRHVLTTGPDHIFGAGPTTLVAGTDTLSTDDVIVAGPGDHARLILQDGNRFDLSAPLVLYGVGSIEDRSVGDSVITLRDGLDATLQLGTDNATVFGALDRVTILGGPAGGFATVHLGSARESVVAGPSGAMVYMQTAQQGAHVSGLGVTTMQLDGRYGDAVRLGGEICGVGELAIGTDGMRVVLDGAGIGAVDLQARHVLLAAGAATTRITDHGGDNTIVLSGAGQSLVLIPGYGGALAADHVAGFGTGDSIDLDLAYGPGESLSYDAANGLLTVSEARGGMSQSVWLTPGAAQFTLSADGGLPNGDRGTLVRLATGPAPGSGGAGDGGAGDGGEAPCFAAGTRIATPRGPVPVERLAIGDEVVTLAGAPRRLCWVGHREIALGGHPRPELVMPVRICAGALETGLPHEDVVLSPDHALFLDGVLVPVKYLVNGGSIRREAVERVRYFHLELASHDVILAGGLPVESYLDTGNRHQFSNGGRVAALHPQFGRSGTPDDRREQGGGGAGCARLVTEPGELDGWRAALMDRACELGFAVTQDAGLHLLADGQRVWGSRHGAEWRFWVPPGARDVRVRSRAAAPADTMVASQDRRQLGVALRHVTFLAAGSGARCLLPEDAGWGSGWHGMEQDGHGSWRWSDGDGVLLSEAWRGLAGPVRIDLRLFRSIAYRLAPPEPAMRACDEAWRRHG